MLKKDFYTDLTNFEKLNLIDKGDSSQIFLIEDKNSKKMRAAKFYTFNLEEFIRKFTINLRYDINIIFNIRYPSILKCIGLGQSVFGDEKSSVLITKLMANKSLTQVIQNFKNANSSDIWNNTKKLINIYGIASAILYLHKKRIFYGYLTPNKILETNLFHPKLFPFVLNNKQKFYFSPEILTSNDEYKISASDDAYSFAMIVYFILTGEEPFANELKQMSKEELIDEIKKGKRPNFGKPIPYVYQHLIEKCWRVDPQKRPSFYKITNILKNDRSFITNTINEYEYKQYIESIETKDINLLEEKFRLDKINTLKLYLYNFKFKKEIGHGGFGYAAKVLQNNDVNEFKHELEIHSNITHPSFTKLLGYSFLSDKKSIKPVIVSEYIKNGSLENILAKERECFSSLILNDTQRLICIYGIASGIEHLHSKKILHLDIKPDNTLLDIFLFPKLIDFGLSKDKNASLKTDKNLRGTIAFIAPEVFQEGLYSEATDVYAFGILVYEIMTQLVPFKDMCDGNIIYKVAYKNERPLFKKKIPPAYRKLIESCWNKYPQRRPSIKQIVNDLKTNSEFIINNVNKKQYDSYIQYIEGYNESIIDEHFPKFSLKSYFNSSENSKSDFTFSQEQLNARIQIRCDHPRRFGANGRRKKRYTSFPQDYKHDEHPELKSMKEKKHENKMISPFYPTFNFKPYPSEIKKSKSFMRHVKNLNFNEFTRKEQIGERKYTKIYKIIEKKTCINYAAKIYNEQYYNEMNLFSNDIHLTHEDKIISILNHPSIIKFIGYSKIYFLDHFKPVIITEYIENGSLERILEIERSNSTVLYWDDTMRLITIYGIASAMSYLHARNIIHRNLRAENILLDDNLFPKLISFDESQILGESRGFDEINTNTIENSIFSAPEIINNNRYSKESDVYSFAMLVYEIMAKQYPYEKVDHFKMLHDVAILKKRPEIPNSVPKAYKNLIESCWNHKSKERLTFDQILNNLRTNIEFITKNVDKNLYFAYIQYLTTQFEGKYDSTKIQHFKKLKVSFSTSDNILKVQQKETKLYIPSNLANIKPSFNIFGTFAGPITQSSTQKNNCSEKSKSKVQSYNPNNLEIEVSLCIEIYN